MKSDWKPIITIYYDEERERMGARIVGEFDASSRNIAGILINILDMLIDKMPEQVQIKVEKEALDIFNSGIYERYRHCGKEKFD